jgi:acetyltransferase-like isoleucine patch superfamily enzyme
MVAEIGTNTLIHHSVTTYGVCKVGSHCLILENVILGYPTTEYLIQLRDHHRFVYDFEFLGVELADNTVLRSASTLYRNVKIGVNFRTGHGVMIRENARIGHHVMLGTASVVDADVTIGNYVSIQSQVYISNGCAIEDHVFLGPNCVLLNDKYPIRKGELKPVRICQGASIGGNATLLPGVTVGEGALVAAGTIVTKDVPPWHLAKGNPAQFSELDESLRTLNQIS